jgi:cephalosporin hydroxylase
MDPKQLLPLAARERLRPGYHRVRKMMRQGVQRFKESSIWPKPAPWALVRQRLDAIKDSGQLYQLAEREFGILQVPFEIVSLLDYVAGTNPKIVGEIGLKHGGNSFMFLRKLENAELFLGMDLVLNNISKLRYYRRPSQVIHSLEGNSQLPAVVNKAERILNGRRFDFLFIDGDHEYNGVLEDLIQWYSLVRPGGLIAFHDIVPDEEAKTGVRPKDSLIWGGGVYRFWARIKDQFEHKEFVKDWDQGGFGIGVIHKSEKTDADVIAWLKTLRESSASVK